MNLYPDGVALLLKRLHHKGMKATPSIPKGVAIRAKGCSSSETQPQPCVGGVKQETKLYWDISECFIYIHICY